MKYNHVFILALVNCCTISSLYSQTSIVGSGSSYNDIFPSSTPVTYDVPGGGLASITLSNGSTTATRGLWDLTAQGGANATILASLTESAAQVALNGSALQFQITNDNNSLLGLLGVGASIHYAWQAVAYFDTPGDVLNYTPNTHYSISFDVDGNNGLLSSVLGLNPSFTFELIDGLGNTLTSSNNTTQINIAGLLGSGVTTGTVNLDYLLGGTAPSGPIGVRFIGDAQVGATALSLGTDFATISNLNISATPVPEPGGSLLIGSVGVAALLRRRRLS
ncbi:PEP-CTERM sorting domain-containing protein [Prosthecobacter fluviatilis]|uniref:PEP-CTERM sorting domain-containing protein n=1 Tax=Prosthecobacter fluviatilis TaxID=445931 RepID=A0ABW0KP26_9BACT